MAERPIAPVLKTGNTKVFEGSNPSPSVFPCRGQDVRFANNLPLPHLASMLDRSIFIGHDSGISHLAAAAGANCILLFGPTNPDVWAPKNKNVRVLSAQSGRLSDLEIGSVHAAITEALCVARQ